MRKIFKSLPLRMVLTGLCAVVIMFGFSTGSVLAHDDPTHYDKSKEPHESPHKAEPPTGGHKNLAEAATNPVANLVQFQIQDVYNWNNYNSDGYGNDFIIQPVIPIPLPWKSVPLWIMRATIPYVTTPRLADPVGRRRGFGDLTILNLFTPKLKAKGIQVGLGPTIVVPLAGDNEFTGNGKWQAGPTFLYINLRTPQVQWGALVYQLWDFASASGGSDRPGVSKLSLQPFINYHMKKGWYVGSPETPQTYDFKSSKWTWALGPNVGRVFKLGKRPVKMFGAVYYNPESNNGPTARWTAKFGITFLFPE